MRKCQNLQWMPSKAYLQKQAKGRIPVGKGGEGMGLMPGSEATQWRQPCAAHVCPSAEGTTSCPTWHHL